MDTETRDAALRFLRESAVSHLATVWEGNPVGRAMQIARVDDDFTLWYATAAGSPKMRHLEGNPRVCVTASDGARDVRVFGRARVVSDQATRHGLWRDAWRRYFKFGKDDPQYVLLRVAPEAVEYRDLSRSLLPREVPLGVG